MKKVPFWYVSVKVWWHARIDGKSEQEFKSLCKCCSQEGWPAYVMHLRDAGELHLGNLTQKWTDQDKKLKIQISDAEEREPEARKRRDLAEEAYQEAKGKFSEVKETISWHIGFWRYLPVIISAFAEVGLNYEPARALVPQLSDRINLFIAFAMALFIMGLAEITGEQAKQKNWTAAGLIGTFDLLALIVIGVFREQVAMANLLALQKDGLATGKYSGSPTSLMVVSIMVAALFAVASGVVGYRAASSSEHYHGRIREYKQRKEERDRAEKELAALTNKIAQSKAKQEHLQSLFYFEADQSVNIIQQLAFLYLVHYNRRASPNNRKAFIHPELPIAIPQELIARKEPALAAEGATLL